MSGVPNPWVTARYQPVAHWEPGHWSSGQVHEASFAHAWDLDCMCETIPPTPKETAKAIATSLWNKKGWWPLLYIIMCPNQMSYSVHYFWLPFYSFLLVFNAMGCFSLWFVFIIDNFCTPLTLFELGGHIKYVINKCFIKHFIKHSLTKWQN